MTDKQLQNRWNFVAEKAIENYSGLERNERAWFNIRCIIDSTINGGLISYYYNNGAENVYDAIQDLKLFDLISIATIIENYNLLLFRGNKVPKNIDKRNEYIETLEPITEDLLQNLESRLMMLEEEMETKLIEGLRSKE